MLYEAVFDNGTGTKNRAFIEIIGRVHRLYFYRRRREVVYTL